MKNCRVLIESQDIAGIIDRDLLETMPLRYLKKNKICYPESPRILILKKGKLKVSLIENEKEIILYFLTKNNFCFCNEDIFVRAKEDSEFYILESHHFSKLFESKNFCNLLLNNINKNLLMEREIIKALAFKHSCERIVEFLIETAETIGIETPEGIIIDMQCTMEETAAFLGMSRQSLSYAINEMIEEDLLQKLEHKKILIKNRDKLISFCKE
jgi:CRP-like cAMP-binding protein